MQITFEEYDNIVKNFALSGKNFDHVDLSKIEHPERLLEKKNGIECLICLLEYGQCKSNADKRILQEINDILKNELEFVEENETTHAEESALNESGSQ